MADAGTLLPSDKDEYTLQDGKIRQTRCRMQVDDLAAVFTIRVVGKADEVVPMALGFRKGAKVVTATLKSKFDELASTPLTALKTSGTVESSVMDTDDGLFCNWEGKVRIPFVKKPEVDDGDYQMTKSAVWDETSCQYQYPLERYAGETGGDGPTEQEFPDAGKFEAWKNENGSDATKYRAFKAELDGQEIDLEHRTLALAKKVYAGKQQVERYYPEVTRTTTYRYIEAAGDDIDEAMPSILAEIDETYEAPPASMPRKDPAHYDFVRNPIPLEDSDILITPENSDGKWLLPIRDLKKDIKTDSRETYEERAGSDEAY